MVRYAFHRTHTKNIASILVSGIISMMSKGFTFPTTEMSPSEYEKHSKRLHLSGFKFTIPALADVLKDNQWQARRDYYEARRRFASTFVTIGGVDHQWQVKNGATVMIDLDLLPYDMDMSRDYYCNESAMIIDGDIPVEAVVQVVSDLWMIENGFSVCTIWE